MGLLRLFLALSVIVGHSQTTVFGFKGLDPWYAVTLFFVISGFYMAMVLNGKYRNTRPLQFYKSRALRLFPVYYIGLALCLMISFQEISSFFASLSSGARFFYIFQNMFIIGQDMSYVLCPVTEAQSCAIPSLMTINPPAWSLSVELGFYLVAPFILRSGKKTFWFTAAGCLYLLCLNGIEFPLISVDFLRDTTIHGLNYYFYPASFIFFGAGALAYHLSKKDIQIDYYLVVALVIALSFTQTIMPSWHLLFICMAIPGLFKYTKNNRVDRFIGELSYPAYILHFPLIVLLKPYASSHPEYFSFLGLGSWVAVLSCLLGAVIYWVVERRVNVYREITLSAEPDVKSTGATASPVLRFMRAAFFLLPVAVLAHVWTFDSPARTALSDTTYNWTDSDWLNGVHQTQARFFVGNTVGNREGFVTGAKVKFANDDVRVVKESFVTGAYLTVVLEGTPIDGNVVGYPSKLQLIR